MAYKQKGYSAFTQVNESKKDSLYIKAIKSSDKHIQQLQDKYARNNAKLVFKDKNGKIINMDSMLLNPPRPTHVDSIKKNKPTNIPINKMIDKDFVGEY